MALGEFSLFEWLVLVEHELLLFAGIFFIIGALDELAVDLLWLWLRLTGRSKGLRVSSNELRGVDLLGKTAVFIPTWREGEVIGPTIAHIRSVWPQEDLRLYVGCYANDPETLAAASAAAASDPRARIVVHERQGPTTKADCLNRLYRALRDDETRWGEPAQCVILHDAEDMVDSSALGLIDRALDDADFVQLPVLPAPKASRQWVANHYCDEFAEAHCKAMVVRDALGLAIPAAGVGCAFSREILEKLAARSDTPGDPFSVESLTEDYELGLRVRQLGGQSRFLRVRDESGKLVATRACFPDTLPTAVRQKTRWIHGIAFQGWDRLGWSSRPLETWMLMRDRRGPLAALVLAMAYLLLVLAAIIALWAWFAERPAIALTPFLAVLIGANFASFVWRALVRFAFTSRDYGRTEGLLAILRIPLSNIITIMAGRRAIMAYIRSLFGAPTPWDKTEHATHPLLLKPQGSAA